MSKKPSKSLAQELDRYITPFRHDGSGKFHLKDHKTDERGDLDKEKALAILDSNKKRMIEFQEKLYAQDRWSLLIVFQAMDAGGKDSAIKAIFEGINPQGCEVHAFKAPSSRELDHDFLWRHMIALPERGRIGIFNRSHYEDVLVVKVRKIVKAKEIEPRYEQINAFERLLVENGTTVLKFMLHISKAEQKERLQERLDDPHKHWKFNPGDLEDRKLWGEYRTAYETVLSRCSTDHAPWYVIPADRKWARNAAIAAIVRETLEDMNPRYPKVTWDPKSFTIE